MEEKQDNRSWWTKIGGAIAILASSSGGFLVGDKFLKIPMAGGILSGIIGGITLVTLQELQQSKVEPKQIDKKTNRTDRSLINYRTDHAERIKSEQKPSTQSVKL